MARGKDKLPTRPTRGRGGGGRRGGVLPRATSRAALSRMSTSPPMAAVCGICSGTVVAGADDESPSAICDACSKSIVDGENCAEPSQVVCGVCSKDIIDGEDDALLCEGPCACWLHRHCAGITLYCYGELAKSSSPFVCYGCSLLTQRSEISRLQSEIDILSSIVAGLCSGKNDGDSSTSVKKQVKHQRSQESHSRSASTGNSRSSIPVENARKVWGTMKAATSNAVLSTIKRIAPNLNSLTVKRKFKVSNGSTKRWWHVVRGSKVDIDLLDSDWNKIQTQTGWKLQSLFSFSPSITAVPVPTNLIVSTASSVVPPNNGLTTTTSTLLPTTAPVLDLSTYTPVSPQVLSRPLTASGLTNNASTVLESSSTVLESSLSHNPTASLPASNVPASVALPSTSSRDKNPVETSDN